MASLSNLVNNIFEANHRIKYKYGNNDKKFETCGIRWEISNCFHEYTTFKDDLTEYKCFCCYKNYQ